MLNIFFSAFGVALAVFVETEASKPMHEKRIYE